MKGHPSVFLWAWPAIFDSLRRSADILVRMNIKTGGQECPRSISYSIIFCLLLFALCSSACSKQNVAEQKAKPVELTVAAASNLASAFEELGRLFEQETGIKVTFSFSSTGTLVKQIQNGLPADVLVAANLAYVDELEKQGLILPDTKAIYAIGRITLWRRADSPLQIERLEDLARPEIKHIAIANPEHAPYGMAAREALQKLKLWEMVQAKLVLGENIQQALRYAETGNAEVSITALSLSVQSKGRWTLLPADLHKPLEQALAVIKNTSHEKEARQFASFINSAQGRPVMQKHGFTLPGEQAVD
jgi:molybdate transport system substrate-binding protein